MALGRSGWVWVLLAAIGLCGWLSAAEPEKATPPATPAPAAAPAEATTPAPAETPDASTSAR